MSNHTSPAKAGLLFKRTTTNQERKKMIDSWNHYLPALLAIGLGTSFLAVLLDQCRQRWE